MCPGTAMPRFAGGRSRCPRPLFRMESPAPLSISALVSGTGSVLSPDANRGAVVVLPVAGEVRSGGEARIATGGGAKEKQGNHSRDSTTHEACSPLVRSNDLLASQRVL